VAGPDAEPAEKLFRVEVLERESKALLVMAGQIGSEAAGELREQAEVLAAGSGDVTLDWREAETLTASGLQLLLALALALSERGRSLRVAGDNAHIRHSLELAGLSKLFPCAEPSR
jgi:anti-anti-sigma factor